MCMMCLAATVAGSVDWAAKKLAFRPEVSSVRSAPSPEKRTVVAYWHNADPSWASETPKGFLSGLENPNRRDYFKVALPKGATTNDAPCGRALVVLLHGRNGGIIMDASAAVIDSVDQPNSVFFTPPDAYAMSCDSLANLLSDFWYGSMPPPRTIYSDSVGNLAAAGGRLKPLGGHYGACDAKALGMKVLGGNGPQFYQASDFTHWGSYTYIGFMWGYMNGEMFEGPKKEPFRTYRSDPGMTCLKWNLSHENAVFKRILDEIEWVVRKYGIDRNRIYLTGNSMGAQAAIALGMTHGEVFAAVHANVPATVWLAAARMGFVDEKGADAAEESFVPPPADPAPVFDWSGSDDAWSRERDVIYRNADRFRFAYTGWWADYGHCGSLSGARAKNDLVMAGVDFFSIRKDRPYVVFSGADCNDGLPWPEAGCARTQRPVKVAGGVELKSGQLMRRAGSPAAGQWNAWLKGEVTVDKPGRLEVEVWIATPAELPSAMFERPAKASAAVTVRRIRNFRHSPGTKARWSDGRNKGTIVADKFGVFPAIPVELEAGKRVKIKIVR